VIVPEELRHLTDGPRPDERPGGAGTISLLASGGTDARTVLARCRSVLRAVLDHSAGEWPAAQEWRSLLPAWFVAACAPERSREELEQWLAWWRTLAPDDRARADAERPWALADWLYWLMPSERCWFWWDAEVRPGGTLLVLVEVPGLPTALGALDWMLRAAGATDIIHE
jgi:hypothetical protein